MVGSAIRFLAAKAAKAQAQAQAQVKVQAQTQTQTLVGSIQLLCHVKPGVSANREGIAAVSDDAVEVCVAAQAREGEANKAVREVIAQVLNVPKSDVEIAKGMKGREKTVIVSNIKSKSKTTDEEVERIRIILERSAGRL